MFVDHTGRRRAVDAKHEGAFALHALEFGTYWVTASADGYRSVEETLELSPNGPLIRKDFELRKSVELRIKVTTPDGENLLDVLSGSGAPSGARLLVPIATRDPPGKRFDQLVGCLNDRFGVGRFQNYGARVEKLATEYIGVLLLDCDLPVYVSLVCHNVVLQSKLVAGGQDEVTFVQSPEDLLASLATIRVRIVDSTTELPIERARVMLRGGTYSSEGVATDQQGIAIIDRREPGLFDLQVSAKGYEKFRRSIDALPGEVADLGTIELEREVVVEGRVSGPGDHALAMPFSLGVLDPSDRSIRWFRQDGFASRADGTFEIRGLGRAEYVIRTSNHDAANRGAWEGPQCMSGNVLVDTRTGPISGLEVCVRPASRLVLHFTGRVADGMRLRVADDDGIELVTSVVNGSEPRSLELPAGRYGVSVLDSRASVLSVRSVVLGSETLELDLAR
jgi:hypothetical protein